MPNLVGSLLRPYFTIILAEPTLTTYMYVMKNSITDWAANRELGDITHQIIPLQHLTNSLRTITMDTCYSLDLISKPTSARGVPSRKRQSTPMNGT
jgi:hypothetical protein